MEFDIFLRGGFHPKPYPLKGISFSSITVSGNVLPIEPPADSHRGNQDQPEQISQVEFHCKILPAHEKAPLVRGAWYLQSPISNLQFEIDDWQSPTRPRKAAGP
jgi:hypothetical protein